MQCCCKRPAQRLPSNCARSRPACWEHHVHVTLGHYEVFVRSCEDMQAPDEQQKAYKKLSWPKRWRLPPAVGICAEPALVFSRGFAHGIQTKTRRWCRSWPLRLQIVLSVIGSEELRAATQLLLLPQHHYSGCFSSSHCCRRCQQKSSNLCRSGDRKSGETHADDKEDVRNVRCFYPWECQFSKVSVCSQGHYVSCLPGGQETRRRACAGPIPGLIAVLCSFF